jgi:mycothiol synthase
MNINHSTKKKNLTLPEGFTVRPVQMSDLEPVVDMINDSAKREGQRERPTYETFRGEWQQPKFDLATQTRIVLSPDGKPAAFVEFHTDLVTRMFVWHRVHVDYHNTGIGLYLLQWAESAMRAEISKASDDAKIVVHAASRPNDTACEKRFEAMGMEKIRYFYNMRIDMTEAPQMPPAPDGVTIRDYRHPEDLRVSVRADLDGFKDHWGFVEPDFEEEVAYVKHMIDSDPIYDTELNILAIDDATGNIAGLILARMEEWDDPSVGYVSSLAVLREYRGRGLGSYLLKLAFKRIFEKGKPNITLGVDADSLTGATRLYEKAGMHVDEIHPRWEKVLRDGVDTMTTDLSE